MIVTIIGQGYVGLPLAKSISLVGIKCFGLDRSRKVLENIKNSMELSISSPYFNWKNYYTPTNDYSVISKSQIICICLPTPLNNKSRPDLSNLTSALSRVKRYINNKSLIIIESTVNPGFVRNLENEFNDIDIAF